MKAIHAYRLFLCPALLLLSGCIVIGPSSPMPSKRGEWTGRIASRTYYDKDGATYFIAVLVVESGTKLPSGSLTYSIETGFPLALIDEDKRAIPVSSFAPDARVRVTGTMTGSVVRSPDGRRFLCDDVRDIAEAHDVELSDYVIKVRSIRTIDDNTKEKALQSPGNAERQDGCRVLPIAPTKAPA